MLADQLSDLQAYARQRTAELGVEPGHVPAEIETLGLDLLKIRRSCRTQITVIR
jgi:hypothetical protein